MLKLALDANVIIYAVEIDSEFHSESEGLLRKTYAPGISTQFSELTYLELTSKSELSADEARVFAEKAGKLVNNDYPINMDVLITAATLRRNIRSLKTPDAIHLASAIENHATHFVTNDQNILKQKIKGIKSINLKSAESLTSNVN